MRRQRGDRKGRKREGKRREKKLELEVGIGRKKT